MISATASGVVDQSIRQCFGFRLQAVPPSIEQAVHTVRLAFEVQHHQTSADLTVNGSDSRRPPEHIGQSISGKELVL